MLDQRWVTVPKDKEREQIFLARYDRLLGWALRLTRQREVAEDLVQEAFVQFMRGRSQLSVIKNIDAYLSRILRHMHVARMTRLAQHCHVAIDRESPEFVRDVDADHRMQVSQELYQVCFYACRRKNLSRVGSVLILRFFHDYCASEIAKITKSSTHCVYELQRVARREARAFMNNFGARAILHTIGSEAQGRYSSHEGDLIIELRQMIFQSNRGACLTRDDLEELYSDYDGRAITTSKLAHVVSCRCCLDAINHHLELPTLAEREEAYGPVY